MNRNLDNFMSGSKYLPPIMRDFHDCKDLFKNIHRFVAVDKHEYCKDVNWVVGHCYVVDIFLWYMARRGYTLQRSRAKVEFLNDIETQTETRRDEELEFFREAFSKKE